MTRSWREVVMNCVCSCFVRSGRLRQTSASQLSTDRRLPCLLLCCFSFLLWECEREGRFSSNAFCFHAGLTVWDVRTRKNSDRIIDIRYWWTDWLNCHDFSISVPYLWHIHVQIHYSIDTCFNSIGCFIQSGFSLTTLMSHVV